MEHRALPSLRQRAMDQLDADRAFADRRCDALDAAGANVAHREDAWTIGLEEIRRAWQRPPRSREIVGAEVDPRLDESLAVERHASFEPLGMRLGARHQKNVGGLDRACRPFAPPPLDCT